MARNAAKKSPSKNKLYVGDNLDVMHGMNSNTVDLIYLDPPFNSKRMYQAPIGSSADKKAKKKGIKTPGFHDIWVWSEDVDIRLLAFMEKHRNLFTYIELVGATHGQAMKTYLTFMAQRIIEMHRLLKDTGSLYLHCDPTASHYLKLILDMVFGKHNFRNEIIWHYDGPQRPSKKNFGTKHDVIFRYAKTENYFANEKGIAPMLALSTEDIAKLKKKDGRYYYDLPKGDYTDESIARLDKEGRIRWTSSGKPRVMYFMEQVNGKVFRAKQIHDVWNDITSLGHAGGIEKTGYPTQKPLALMDRIVKASSNEGDMVLDPFCGCATTCVAAQNHHRNWIGIDLERSAVESVSDRLSQDESKDGSQAQLKIFSDFEAIDIEKTPVVRTDLEPLTWSREKVRQHLFGVQDGACKGCKVQFPSARHFHVDHIYPDSKGGPWHLDNLQLLCGNCNSVKGDRPMEYLLLRIKERRDQLQLF